MLNLLPSFRNNPTKCDYFNHMPCKYCISHPKAIVMPSATFYECHVLTFILLTITPPYDIRSDMDEAKFFLHPKVQMVWIERAAQLGVQALLVGLLLHFKVVLSKADEVTLPQNLLDRFQLSRGVKRRALGKLEQAGLISIVRRTGRSSLIKLLRV